MMFLGIIVIAVIVYVLLKPDSYGKKSFPDHLEDDPMAILKKRYAEGSIDRDEYIRMRDELKT